MDMPVTLQIILAIVSLLGSIVGITAMIVVMKTKVENQQIAVGQITAREAKDAEEFHQFVVTLKEFMASQSEINKQVAGLLTSLSDKVDLAMRLTVEQPLINKQVTDNLGTITVRLEAVAKASVESAAVLALAGELIKRRPIE